MLVEMGKMVEVVAAEVVVEIVAVAAEELAILSVVVASLPSSSFVVVTLAVSVATGFVTVVNLALD